MFKKVITTFACAFAVCLGAHSQTYDAFKDFSLKANPNGVWSYGQLTAVTGGNFVPFTKSHTNKDFVGELIWDNGGVIPDSVSAAVNNSGTTQTVSVTVALPTNEVNIDGEDLIADLRFTAPKTALYDLTGLFQRTDIYANPVNVYIVKDETDILFSATQFTGYGTALPFDQLGHIALTAGATLDFVESAGQYNNDSTGVEARLAVVSGTSAARSGKFTLLLSATDNTAGVPAGTGYATMTVGPGGGVIMAGRLPDGERFRTSGALVGGTTGSQFMVYDTLRYRYLETEGAKGLLIGSLTFETDSGGIVDGTLEWVKPPQKFGKYKAVIDTNLNVIGSAYTPPAAGESALPGFTTGTLELTDGGALRPAGPTPLKNTVTLTAGNQLKITKPDSDKVTVRITAATGTFEGTFLYPGEKTPREFGGVVLQNETLGGGFFLGRDGSGTVSLTPSPR